LLDTLLVKNEAFLTNRTLLSNGMRPAFLDTLSSELCLPHQSNFRLIVGGDWVFGGFCGYTTKKKSTNALLFATNTEVNELRIELNLKYSVFH
jgi:hypothetical protein